MDDNQCRACLGEALDPNLSLEREVDGVSIGVMIEKLTQTIVSQDDMFSKTVCRKCFNEVINAFLFRRKFLDTERTLRGFEKKLLSLQNVKREPSPKYITHMEPTKISEEYLLEVPENIVEKASQHFVMEIADEQDITPVVTYETDDEPENIQYEEYEEIEYLETDNPDQQELKCEEVAGVMNYYCFTCNESFKTEFGMRNHLFFIHLKGSNPTVCEICNIQFPIKGKIKSEDEEEAISHSIQIHYACHNEGKHHSCSSCFLVFKTLKQLNTHKRNIHEYAMKPFHQCKCLATFPSLAQLHEHQDETKCNVPEKSFQCYICNKIFAMGIAKKKHIQEDHKDKAGQDCPLCVRCKIPSAVAYENHMKTHYVAPRFSCNFCSQAFYESDRLQMHIKRFHDRTRYYCFFCNKDFKDKSGIARHILGVHFDARNFKCTICAKAFTANYNLKEHMFAVHKQASTIYKCELCSQDFLYRKQFERHRSKCQGTPEPKRKR